MLNLFDREKRVRNLSGLPAGDYVLLINDNLLDVVPVIDFNAEQIETSNEVFPRSEAKEYVRPEGGRVFAYQMELEVRSMGERMKELKNSVVLKAVFGDFGVPESRMKNLPWWIVTAILGILVLLHK